MSTILERRSRGILPQAKGDCFYQDHSDLMILRAVRQPKALKTKLTQGWPSGLSLLRSYHPCDGQAGGWMS